MTLVEFCCSLLLRNLLQEQKSVPQPRQNAAATKLTTNVASNDTADDVILIAGVLYQVILLMNVNANEAFGLVDG